MDVGTHELARTTTAYVACIAFVLAFLVATLAGGGGLTAVARGTGAALAAWLLGRPLARAALSAVLDAMAKDRAAAHKDGAE